MSIARRILRPNTIRNNNVRQLANINITNSIVLLQDEDVDYGEQFNRYVHVLVKTSPKKGKLLKHRSQ